MRLSRLGAAILAACVSAPVFAADFSDFISIQDPADGSSLQNSLMLFGGAMSTTNLGSTLLFNTVPNFGLPSYHPHYDNYIVGLTYQRDLYRFTGFVVAGEIGIADRFGHYAECCAPIEQTVVSSSIHNAGELWFGPALRYEALVLGNVVRVVPGFTAGFSVVTNSIGSEEGKVVYYNGNGTFLGYLGFDVAFSLVSAPAWELVIEEHHRSGAAGTFGKLYEGYNANVAGLRYHF